MTATATPRADRTTADPQVPDGAHALHLEGGVLLLDGEPVPNPPQRRRSRRRKTDHPGWTVTDERPGWMGRPPVWRREVEVPADPASVLRRVS